MIGFSPKLMMTQRTNPVLPDTLFDYIIHNNYLNDFDYGQYWDPSSSQVCQTITGTLSKGTKNIQYLGVNTFILKAAYYDPGYSDRPIHPVLKNFFSAMRQQDCDGLILDLRNNRGGNLEDIDFLVGQFTASPLLFGYMRYKSGSGRLDYTPSVAMNVTPQPGATDFNKKIVILTDAYTASLSEKVIMAFKALPSATVVTIGATTYGSCGLISADGIATNSGSFAMATFGSVQLSNIAVEDTRHQFTMGGIVPDVKVAYDATGIAQMLKTGVDIQMEAAIRYLNQ
jgi:C-terminal processing protease CtpA/Prc